MQIRASGLSPDSHFSRTPDCLTAISGIEYAGLQKFFRDGYFMQRLLLNPISGAILAGLTLTGMAYGQGSPAQSVLSAPSPVRSANSPAAADRGSETSLDPASLVPDLPALSPKNTTLVGGTIKRLDRLRDELTLEVFGGGKMNIAFDTRTHLYRDGAPASTTDIHQGDRVYVDTILNNNKIFARNIRLKTNGAAGASQGVVVSYNVDKGELLVRDPVSPEPLKLRVTAQTRLVDRARGASASAAELVPGTLVALSFATKPQQDNRDAASEINILASPGASFTFAGHVTGLDLRAGLLVLTNATDGKSYDIYLDPATVAVNDKLQLASDVIVLTRFDGSRYVASSLTIN
jgi:hypothetical protein